MTFGEKALALAYTHCELLVSNLEIAIHELNIKQEPSGQLTDKLVKLKSAAKNAFKSINKLIADQGELEELKTDIEDIMDQTWSGE